MPAETSRYSSTLRPSWKSRLPPMPDLDGRASTLTWSRANSAPGCSSARSSQHSICRLTPRSQTAAAVAAHVSIFAQLQLSLRLTSSTHGDAFPTSPSSTKGLFRRELRTAMGNRIFGCDDCLAVCPWNKFASQGREAKLAARDALRAPRLADLVRLDEAQFRTLFAKTSIKRTGRDRFVETC